jgi:pimeloyl-ACP methyl ester carboxylesterase
MARFLLIHGAWHGGWCWQDVVCALEARGHEVDAPDLPCDEVGLTAGDYAARLPAGADVVVGPTMGARTAALVDGKKRVYLGGLLPVTEEESLVPFVDGFAQFVRDELDRSYWPDADTCARCMYPDLRREESDRAYAQLRPQARLANEGASLCPDDIVIVTSRDAAIDPEWQRRMARAYGARIIELDSGHSPFLTQPDELADLLNAIAGEA